MRILIIEDELELAAPISKYLHKHGFVAEYELDGLKGYHQALQADYDCLILDLNLPGMDGLEICEKLRAEGKNTPIIMLTARRGTSNTVTGLDRGADDYLTKPFHMQELLARVNALVRRGSQNSSLNLQFGDIQLDPVKSLVFKADQQVTLNRKEYSILEYLMRNSERPVSAEELLEHVWGETENPFTQTIKTHIKTLRQKLDPEQQFIRTWRGKGYIISDTQKLA
jgi:two-component system OmpR family response regulator